MSIAYEAIVKPMAFLADPELVHVAAMAAGRFAGAHNFSKRLIGSLFYNHESGMSATVGTVTYPSVIGLAAGYDKYGDWIDILPCLSAGFEELGTITASERAGNPRPRLFRLPHDYALVNRMGLNNAGAVKTANMLAGMEFAIPLNVSFDPNMFFVEDGAYSGDIVSARQRLWEIPYAKILNVSCPNTSDGRAFETPGKLDALLIRTDVMDRAVSRDVYVKFSHDVSYGELADLVAVCGGHHVTGFVISNTTNGREGLKTDVQHLAAMGKGGLSGRPLLQKNLKTIEYLRDITASQKVIMGSGGIGCDPDTTPARDVFEYLRAGASGVQMLTAIPYRGFGVFKEINKELPKYLKGYSSMEDFLKRR
jgi:dihydroorotate dehydrogenase